MVRFENISIETIDVEEGIRQTIEKEPLDELAASIALHGVLQPLVVEPGEEGRYSLQIGMRRFASAKMAGLEKVPAIILDGPLGAEESLAMRLVENILRYSQEGGKGEDIRQPLDEAPQAAPQGEGGHQAAEHPQGARTRPPQAGALPADRPGGGGHGEGADDSGDPGQGQGAPR